MESWCAVNKLSLNGKKTKYILFKPGDKHVHYGNLTFGGQLIERIGEKCKNTAFKFLGHWVDEQFNWNFHTNKLVNKLNSTNYVMSKVKNKFPFSVRKKIYTSLAQSHLTWGSTITGATSLSNSKKLDTIQNKILRNLCNVNYNAHTQPLYSNLKILKASDLLYSSQVLIGFKFRQDCLPPTLTNFFKYSYEEGDREQRDSCLNFKVPITKIKCNTRYPSQKLLSHGIASPMI